MQRRDMSEYQAHDRKTHFCIVPRPSIVPGMECSQSPAVTLSYLLAQLPFHHLCKSLPSLWSEIMPCLQRSSTAWEASASLVDVESQQSHCSGRSLLDYSNAFRTLP